MSVNLKIGFSNNFITNSSYTKFLGVAMNNHIDLIIKMLSNACYIIMNAKIYMSVCFIIKSDLLCLFWLSYKLWNYILGKLVAQFSNF